MYIILIVETVQLILLTNLDVNTCVRSRVKIKQGREQIGEEVVHN